MSAYTNVHAEIRVETNHPLLFKTNGNNERMRIDSSGNLLVGKTSASSSIVGAQLNANGTLTATVDGARTAIFNRKTSDGEIVALRKDGTTVGSIGTTSGNLYIEDADAGLRFSSASDEISPCGSGGANRDAAINLGASNNRYKDLYLSGTLHGDKYDIYTEGGGSLYQTNGYVRFANGNTETARIDSSGNLLVGKSTAAFGTAGVELKPSGETYVTRASATPLYVRRNTNDGNIVEFWKDNATVGSISVTSSATAYNTSSDERLKENITDSDDAGSKIDAIQIRQFDWKSDGSHQDYGVVAQELLEVAPEAVSEGETEDDMMSVDYSKLVPTLIKEIQTLRNRVAQLENN
jgi:hypothetical protein